METFDTVVPIEQSNIKVIQTLAEDIANGKYNVGVMITPQDFKTTKLVNGEIQEEKYSVHGRKIPLLDIRKEMFEKHQDFLRIRTDEEYPQLTRDSIIEDLCRINEYSIALATESREVLLKKLINFERTRHLMFWHDGSNLANHSHILMTVSVMYDKAIFLTENEYYQKFNVEMKNIQSIIEEPFLYILSRCPATDAQLSYIATRCEDLELLNETISWKGAPIKDKMRLFKGDGPAAQFEAGQQKGGKFPCWGCSIHKSRISDFVHASSLPLISLNDRVDKVLASLQSLKASKLKKTKLYTDLSIDNLILELQERGIKLSTKQRKYKIQYLLTEEMHGIQRLPSLLFDNPTNTLNDMNLDHYEISTIEPLHDVGNHIKNIYEEIPLHLTALLRKDLSAVIKASFNDKIEKKTADYRLSLVHVVSYLIKNHSHTKVLAIFETLLNIVHLLYMPYGKRTNKTILSLYTDTRHAGDYYRIVPGSTIHTEKEERSFTRVKSITNNTSNRHAQHVINNVFVRVAVCDKREKKTTSQRLENKISKEYENLMEMPRNTFVSFQTIEKHPFQYQCFLESIADFLLECNAYWNEISNGILFFDNIPSQNISNKQIHHFRSFTVKEEATYVKECWQKCLEKADSFIPAKVIKVNEEGEIKHLKCLNFFNVSCHNSTPNNLETLDKSNMSISLTPLGNDLKLTPVVNEIFSLDIQSPSDISIIFVNEHVTFKVSIGSINDVVYSSGTKQK